MDKVMEIWNWLMANLVFVAGFLGALLVLLKRIPGDQGERVIEHIYNFIMKLLPGGKK